MGNGAAMRVAPLGAYFADDTAELVRQATLSAEVTHAHPEGQAGAVAVALAAGFAANHPDLPADQFAAPFFEFVLRHTPDSQTRALVSQARDLPAAYSVPTAASVLGNGSKLTAPDTVPFCLWVRGRVRSQFRGCHVDGGVRRRRHGHELRHRRWDRRGGGGRAPPAEWLKRREPLPEPLE